MNASSSIYYGLEILVVGFSVVFIILIALALVLVLFSKILAPAPKKTAVATGPAVEAGRETASAVSQVEDKAGDKVSPEMVAAAVGVVLCMLEPFREETVKSKWATDGRKRLLESRREFAQLRKEKVR